MTSLREKQGFKEQEVQVVSIFFCDRSEYKHHQVTVDVTLAGHKVSQDH